VRPERDLVVAVAAARHDEGQVIKNALAETMYESKPVGGGQIDSCLPFVGAAIF
jgi:hypothetical protein